MPEKITREPIMKIIWGMWSFRTLYAAIDLEVFTKIDNGSNTSEKIAIELKTKKRAVERLLNACVSLNLLTKDNETYNNTPETNQFLVKGKPSYYGDMMIMNSKGDSLKNLEKAILTNSPINIDISKRMDDKEHAKTFTRAMHNNAVGPAMVLSKKLNLSKSKKLLDLGGGSGAFSIILTKQYQNLSATVFDLPNVCSVAEEYIKEANLQSRVSTFKGDFFKDEFPKDHDSILLSQILHSFGKEENKTLLKKAYDYLPKGGVIIINEFLLNEDKTGPLFPALFALNMLVQSDNGNAYTESEIKDWLKDVGFEHLETIPLTGPVSSIVGRK